MLVNLFILLVFMAFIVLFVWLAMRAWRSKNVLVKWGGLSVSGLLALVVLLVTGVMVMGMLKAYAPVSNPVAKITVPSTPDQIARGEKIAQMCTGCHSVGAKLPLIGGKENFAAIPNGPTLGSIYSPNLTPAGETKDWSDGEIVRAIREGVHKSGRPLLVMPTESLRYLSDADVQALVAYLRSQPATKHKPENDTPTNSPNLMGLLMLGMGVFNNSVQSPITQPIATPPPGVNLENGKYLATVLACGDCHGRDFKGGVPGALRRSVQTLSRWHRRTPTPISSKSFARE